MPHTFRLLGRWRGVAEAKLHASIIGIGVFPYRPLQIIDGDAVTHTIGGIGDDLISINAEKPKDRLAKRLPQRVPDRNFDRRQRLMKQAAGADPVRPSSRHRPDRFRIADIHSRQTLRQLAGFSRNDPHQVPSWLHDITNSFDTIGHAYAREDILVCIDHSSGRLMGVLHRNFKDFDIARFNFHGSPFDLSLSKVAQRTEQNAASL